MSAAAGIPRKIAFWCYELQRPMFEALKNAGYEVRVQLQGDSSIVPAHDLASLHAGQGLPMSKQRFNSHRVLPPDVLWDYAACIVRVNVIPRFGIVDTSRIGPIVGDTIADWAQFHYRNAVRVLRHYEVDELWLIDIPHLGVDNMFVQAALDLDLPVLVFRQSSLPGKFEAFEIGKTGYHSVAVDGFATIAPNSVFEPVIPINLITMNQSTRGVGKSLPWLAWSICREILSAPRKAVSRLYLGASRRNWSWLRFLIETLDPVSRPLAPYRLARWSQRPRFDVRSRKPSPSELSKPYALFALHYEPEANVRAFSDGYANQVNAIEALAAWIPDEWLLLVRENPLQRGYARDEAFHLRLAGLDNVRFVDASEPSAELVCGAKLVATITGTMGFEALMAGKPCFYFGMPWYRHLPGAHRFSPNLDLQTVLDSAPERSALALAILSVSRRMPDGIVFPRFLPQAADESERHDIAQTTAASIVAVRRAGR